MRTGVISLAALAVVAASLVSQTSATSAPSTQLVLSARGLSVAQLGAHESVAEDTFIQLLGPPSTPLTPSPGLSNCGFDASSSWHGFSAYFDHGRLVGLSLGPSHTPTGRTSTGLELGDTLGHARALYGVSLHASTEQGGTWFARTSDGRVDGFLVPSTGRTPKASARILTIDVGVVGCPAMSP